MRKTCCFILLVTLAVGIQAQDRSDVNIIRRHRINQIDFYHLSAGLTFGFNQNYAVGPKVSFGCGTFRNTFCMDFGLRYLFINPLLLGRDEYLSMGQIPLFVLFCVNLYRWSNNSLYMGTEMSYVFEVNESHRIAELSQNDGNLGNSHFSSMFKLGLRMDNYDISLYCQYRLGPAFNQKYIFESYDYEFVNLYNSIFERWITGIEITYHFAL